MLSCHFHMLYNDHTTSVPVKLNAANFLFHYLISRFTEKNSGSTSKVVKYLPRCRLPLIGRATSQGEPALTVVCGPLLRWRRHDLWQIFFWREHKEITMTRGRQEALAAASPSSCPPPTFSFFLGGAARYKLNALHPPWGRRLISICHYNHVR